MDIKNVLFSSLLTWNAQSNSYNLDNTWNLCEISPEIQSKAKKTRRKRKNKKSKIKKGRIIKQSLENVEIPKTTSSRPLYTSTPIKQDLYEVEKIRNSSSDDFKLSPVKESTYDIINFDDFTVSDHPSMDPFYCSKLIEPGTALRYEYENGYQYTYKVVDEGRLELLTKRYYPYAGCVTFEEKKKLKAKLEEKKNISTLSSQKEKSIKSALKRKDTSKKLSSVRFDSFICRQKLL
uniref:YL1_C domain-containing protein n=1 Tax=Strongyloides venezuelensis TaxID=75913 RepID=A0A0K0F9L0_STRVS